MKTTILVGLIAAIAGSVLAAESAKDVVTAAANKLNQQDNYSWKSTIEFGNFTGTTEGKTQKDGLTWLSMLFGDNTTEAYMKGDKGAVKRPDHEWESVAELDAAAANESGPGRFLVRRLKALKAPAAEAAELPAKTKELKKEGDAYSGELTEAGAKDLLSFGGRRRENAPEPKNAKGSVKFWLKDGQLSKFEVKVQGTVNFNGEDRDVDRTTVVDIKDVGTTKIEVPEAAKKKLS